MALAFTGSLLPWGQLALWAVTAGANTKGMWFAAFNDDVRFVIIGGSEISQATLRLWFVLHTVVLTAALIGVLALAAGRVYRRPPASPAVPPTSGDRWSNQVSTARS